MSRQAELFARAAECERLMNLTSDPEKKELLKVLRGMWVGLANECAGLSNETLAEDIAFDPLWMKMSSTYQA